MLSPSLNVRENRALASEIKFVVTAAEAVGIAGWARTRPAADPNADRDEYRITSLYFDTDRFDVFHRNGSFGRGKYRIRRYDTSKKRLSGTKLKTHDMVSKRRTKVRIRELDSPLDCRRDRRGTAIGFTAVCALRKLAPVCQVTYLWDRAGSHDGDRADPPDPGPRDRHRAVEGPRFRPSRNVCRCAGEPLILELKFRAPFPDCSGSWWTASGCSPPHHFEISLRRGDAGAGGAAFRLRGSRAYDEDSTVDGMPRRVRRNGPAPRFRRPRLRQGQRTKLLDQFDKDGDGYLNTAERKAARDRTAPRGGRDGDPAGASSAAAALERPPTGPVRPVPS